MNNARGTTLYLLCSWLLLCTGCSTQQKGLFGKKTPHEQYSSRITSAGLAGSELGQQWFMAAGKALSTPVNITLPYQETGYFAAEKPEAAGFSFTARRGEQIQIEITARPADSFRVFADLWKPTAANSTPELLAAADTTQWTIQQTAETDARFILRLQPELLRSGEYQLRITTGPSLAFPVPGTHARIGSFWGDNRDGGNRSHEGIDIFGKFRTPVVAVAKGTITSTRQNNLGGKVVFLRPDKKPYNIYYAHLDEQLVTEGQQVNMGDTLGLMGNTGNARNTPTHLHFGIYTSGGAVDPLPFVKPGKATPTAVTAATDLLQQNARCSAPAVIYSSPARNSTVVEKLPANSAVRILAATASWYKIILPDNREGFAESRLFTVKPYSTRTLTTPVRLLQTPDSTAAAKSFIAKGTTVNLIGSYQGWQLIAHEERLGWIRL